MTILRPQKSDLKWCQYIAFSAVFVQYNEKITQPTMMLSLYNSATYDLSDILLVEVILE